MFIKSDLKWETAARRKKRAAVILRVLKQSYPNARISLRYGNNIQLLVAVILSAQCTDKKVNEITASLFRKYRGADDFARANIKTFEKEIRSSGFYRAKARNIIGAAKMIRERFGGKLPKTMDEMLVLPGVARKTANVVLNEAFSVAVGIAVDTHVRRIARRLGLSTHSDPVKIERDLMNIYPKKEWGKITYLVIEHGRAVCTAKRPRCADCQLNKLCPTAFSFD